jgi:oligosaccharide repeat unit polymerase
MISALLIILSLLAAAGAVLAGRSAASPAGLFGIIFAVQMIFSLALLPGDISGGYAGFFFLLGEIAAFSLGTLAARLIYSASASPAPEGLREKYVAGFTALCASRGMRILLAALLLLAFVQPVSAVVRLGYSPLDLFIPSKLMSINAAAARERYTQGNYLTSAFTQIFLCLVYLLPAAGGWNFEFCRHKRDRLLCAVTLAPALLVLMTQNTKAAFIGASFLFIGAFTAARIYREGSFRVGGRREIKIILPALAAFLALNYLSFILREGSASLTIFSGINAKTLNYLLGQIPAFNHWFCTSGAWPSGLPTLGMSTFYGLSDVLGLMHRSPGIYTVKYVTANLNTNVYTAFRPLVEDFTFPGALAVTAAAGALSGHCFERLRRGCARSFAVTFTVAVYFYIFYAFITSPWAYASYSTAVMMFFIYMLLIRKKAAAAAGGK